MVYNDIQKRLSRSFILSFTKKKYLFTFSVLFALSFLFVLAKSFLSYFPKWTAMMVYYSLVFFTLFVLFYLVFFLCRLYLKSLKEEKDEYGKLFFSSLKKAFATTRPFLLLILFPIGSWLVFFGLFLILKLPFIGLFFRPIFVVLPFIINFVSLVYVFFCLYYIFFAAPFLAFKKSSNGQQNYKLILSELRKNVVFKLILFFLGLSLLLFAYFLLKNTLMLTFNVYYISSSFLSHFFTFMVIMIPICLVVTIPIIFFSNFSAEVYWFINQRSDDEKK